jgi:transcriptional regulator with XRE-family HTH domain
VNYYNFLFLQFGSSFFATPKNKNKKKLAIKQKKGVFKMEKITMQQIAERLGSMILCNNIVNIDNSILENIETNKNIKDIEIFQYYLLDITSNTVDYFKRKYKDLIFSYSEMLDVYVLCVDFFGISWEDVEIEANF